MEIMDIMAIMEIMETMEVADIIHTAQKPVPDFVRHSLAL